MELYPETDLPVAIDLEQVPFNVRAASGRQPLTQGVTLDDERAAIRLTKKEKPNPSSRAWHFLETERPAERSCSQTVSLPAAFILQGTRPSIISIFIETVPFPLPFTSLHSTLLYSGLSTFLPDLVAFQQP